MRNDAPLDRAPDAFNDERMVELEAPAINKQSRHRLSLLTAVALSGLLAGLAGALEIVGVFHRLQAGIGFDYGYTAIPLALVGLGRVGPTLLAALLFAALSVGATWMQLKVSVPVFRDVDASGTDRSFRRR